MAEIDPRAPLIVGVAQSVDRTSDPLSAASPLDFLEQVARSAADDSGAANSPLSAIDWMMVIRTFADSGATFRLPGWNYSNLPRSLAHRLGADPARLTYPHAGGNTPQWAINLFADAIVRGEAEVCLLAGAENMRTAARAQRSGTVLEWTDEPGGPDAEVIGTNDPANTKTEHKHGLSLATTGYALFDNALGHHYGRSPIEHRKALGELMARFSSVAAANPYSIADVARTADEICEPGDDNRYVAYPYTKFLCSNMFVDQAAAVLMMSEEAANRFGIPRDKRVYLQGSAETTEKWFLSDRVNFWSAPAVGVGARAALEQAGCAVTDLDFIDLYSCFASPVQAAADALGIAHDDPRGLTVTGGLVCFGGPGNNYSTHAIAEMATRIRNRRGSRGLVFANGYYLTKHAFGIYSTEPPTEPYRRIDPATYQSEIDTLESPAFDPAPSGEGEIETFTVLFDKAGARAAPLFGRLEGNGARFVAQITDPAMAASLVDGAAIGRRIAVESDGTINTARLI